MKKILKAVFSTLILFVLAAGATQAQDSKTLEKTFTWNYDLGSEGTLNLKNYDCDLIIHTWNRNEAELRLTVKAELRSAEEKKEMENFLNKLKFNNSPALVSFNTRFWENRKNIAGRKTIKLDRGKTLRYKEFRVKAEVWLPATADLDLNSRYSGINLEETSGNVTLNLYSDKLSARDINGKLDITAKYSDIELGNCKELTADLYDSDIFTGSTLDARYVTKYSGITSKIVQNLDIDSYNDKFKFESCGDISMISKYSYLTSTSAGKVKIDSYEGGFELGECENLEVKSKYTDFLSAGIEDMIIESAYSSKFNIAAARSVTVRESKYTSYKLDLLKESFVLDIGYEDKVILDKLHPEFKTIDLNGKYIKCEAGIAKDISYRFKANIKYPHLNLEKADLTTRIKIKESSDLEFEAFRGEESESLPLIKLSGYEITFTIL
ncbi:MAG: hypothetical protein V2I37_03770 [Marinilabiliaceae bacterium]|jgi:hypothetical protein|nr:hypothetical protein [Marinilabiliaceae bacterium]